MSIVKYGPTSPYYTTQQTSWFLSNLSYRSIPRDSTDIFIPALASKYENRPDLLSYDQYNTPNYWWIFMILNPNVIKDPIYDMKTGMSLYIPTLNRLSTLSKAS